jgi:hypothetical protein
MRKIILSSLLILFFAGLFTPAAHSQEPNAASEPNVLAEFTIEKSPMPILLPVEFNGKECLFQLDTGSSHTIFDSSLRHKLGTVKRRKSILTWGGKWIIVEMYDAPQAYLGPFNLEECGEVSCVDVDYVTKDAGRKVHGVIGMDFLKNHIIQIDPDKNRLSFFQPASDNNYNWGTQLPIIEGRYGVQVVRANVLDSWKTYFVIDTGNLNSGSLTTPILNYLLCDHNIETNEATAGGGAGIVRFRTFRIDRLTLGPFEYEGLLFNEDSRLSSLGLAFWSRHIVTFDFPNVKIYLKKGKEFNRIDENDMSGLFFWRTSGQTVASEVGHNSPADKAGIKVGDIMLEIMDKKADSYEMWELLRLLRSGDKREIRMTIKRGDAVLKVSFVLEKRI